MAVVINEFEVVAEQPQPVQPRGGSEASVLALTPTPQDIERIVDRRSERSARIRAH